MFVGTSGEDAGQMLLEADAGFFRDAGRVGINRPEKILDFLLHIPLDKMYVRTARWGDLRWLDLVVHFWLHPTHPQTNLA